MRRSGFGWWRLAKQVVLGTAAQVVSTVQSTFAAASFAPTADGVTTDLLTLTLKDASGTVVPSRGVTFSVHRTTIDAAACTVNTDAATIATTSGVANITAYIYETTPEGHALPGIPAASLVLASTGSNNTITAVDTHTDQNGRFRWTFSSTTAEAKTLSLTACGLAITDTAAVTVGTPGLITPLFASDWRTATGSGDAALRDTSGITAPLVWTVEGGANVVVANSGLGFPAGPTNVLSVPGDTGGIIRVSGLGAQGVGDVRAYRLYFRNDLPYPTTDVQTHPFQDSNAGGDINWEFVFRNAASNGADADHIRIGLQFQATQAIWYEYQFDGPLLDKATVYRLEWTVEYATTTTFNISVRIYNASGTLLYTDDDFSNFGGETLAEFNARTAFVANDIAESDGLNVGTNDVYAEFAPQYGYQAAVAIADNQGWIGAYGSVDGE